MLAGLESAVEEIRAHAQVASPREACGLVLHVSGGSRFTVLRGRNTHHEPTVGFCIDAGTMLAGYGRRIAYVYHSHADGAAPTKVDKGACSRIGIPYLIYGASSREFSLIYPEPWWHGLLGRTWSWGGTDCLALVEDYLTLVHGIRIPRYHRPAENEFRSHATDWFEPEAARCGFRRLPEGAPGKPGDVLAFAIHSKRTNHVGISVGRSMVLHHMRECLSVAETRSPALMRHLRGSYRHAELDA